MTFPNPSFCSWRWLPGQHPFSLPPSQAWLGLNSFTRLRPSRNATPRPSRNRRMDSAAAWFGGTREGSPDVGIWLSRHENGKWTAPVEVATGVQSATNRYPCWNPVLFQPKPGPMLLFYKVGPSPSAWWGMLMTSADGGKTWLKPRRLPEGILGPIKNKPVELSSGDLLCPSSTEDHGWRVHFERTRDWGQTWETTGPLNDGREISAIQPSILLRRRWTAPGRGADTPEAGSLRCGPRTKAGPGAK